MTTQPDSPAFDLIDELSVAYFEIDAQGIITRANRAACALHQVLENEFVGREVWESVAADEKDLGRSDFYAVMESGEEPPVVRRALYARSGEFRTYEMHRSFIRDAKGHPAGLRYISIDVTETQTAHEEAHQAHLWLESVLEAVAEAMIVTDALGFVRYINQAAEELSGWKAAELIGKEIEKGFPVLSYSSADEKSLTHRIALERRTKGIATVLDRNFNELQVEISTSPINGVVSILRRVDD
jgi:PAS domain S-box-containing protein